MPKRADKLRIGTAGIPISTPQNSTIEGIKQVRSLGLDAMEMEFVRGVRMSPQLAGEVKEVAIKEDVFLTAHAPYYINLNSSEKEKYEASIKRIKDTARIAYLAGGYSIVFHAAYYMASPHNEVYYRVLEGVKRVIRELLDEGIDIWVRPETMGKPTQFAGLDELIKLSQEVENVLPCVDFAHLHARSNGKYNTYEEFSNVLESIENGLGREALDNMHIHFSGIVYNEKGEKNHIPLQESDFDYEDLAKAWKDYKIKGVAISESPNIEGDALLMKSLLK